MIGRLRSLQQKCLLLPSAALSVSLWYLALLSMWWCLSQVSFLYPIWYEQLMIGATIEQYAPLNRANKSLFQYTSVQEHERVFTAIVDSIQHSANGLAEIRFYVGERSYALLTPAEIVHLHDVAQLVVWMKQGGIWALLCVLFLFVWVAGYRLPMMSLRMQLITQGMLLVVVLLILLLLGAEQVFYWLHVQVFPDDHQWFFYYQDSLMATLMQAPNIFGPIAVLWLLLTHALWMFLWAGLCRCYRGWMRHFTTSLTRAESVGQKKPSD